MLKTISITVSGKVQGIFYRQSAKEKATALDINGSVKNLDDGSVYIIATGTKEKLDELIRWCYIGPPHAMVTKVEVKELQQQQFYRFTIER
jgi:acylphosphatase